MTDGLNPKPLLGHNGGPSLFEDVETRVDDLYGEAELWLDGATVDSQDLADGLGNLTALLRQAEKDVDAARKTEKQPHLDAGKAVDARYKPLTDKTARAIGACKKAVEPWLQKLAQEQEEAARKAREEAEEAQRKATEAMQAASHDNLAERAEAEEAVEAAKKAEIAARKTEKQTATAGGMMGKSVHLRTYRIASVTSEQDFARYVWMNRHDELSEFLRGLAQRLVDANVGAIPGVEITEEKRVA